MTTEIVWMGHGNTIDLLLNADNLTDEDDLSSVTKITATFKSTTITSENKAAGAITWDQEGYENREIRLDLGNQSIEPGGYDVPIVVYDASNPTGVVWGKIHIAVRAEVEAS